MDRLPCAAFLEEAGAVIFANYAARHLLKMQDSTQFSSSIDDILCDISSSLEAEPVDGMPFHRFTATLLSFTGERIQVAGNHAFLNEGRRKHMIIVVPIAPEQTQRACFMEDVLSSLPEAIAVTRGTTLLYSNPEFTRLFGYSQEEALGRDIADLVLPESRVLERDLVRQTVQEQGRAAIETVRRTKTGRLVDVSLVAAPLLEGGQRVGLSLSYRDIRDRKRMEAGLQRNALHDSLTNLPNRALFLDRLKLAMARRNRRNDEGCGVMFIDLDRFKEVNDSLGHAAGDAVLVEVGHRLAGSIRPQDTAARLGGDEFAILVENLQTVADIRVVADRINGELSRTFEIFGHPMEMGASIGVALCGADHKIPEHLVRDADFAMYRAKEQGGARYEIFDRHMQVHISFQKERERELRHVLDKRQFALWYQPFFRLASGVLEGFESLLRCRREDGSFESFGNFLALAEGTGLSISIRQLFSNQSLGNIGHQIEGKLSRQKPLKSESHKL